MSESKQERMKSSINESKLKRACMQVMYKLSEEYDNELNKIRESKKVG